MWGDPLLWGLFSGWRFWVGVSVGVVGYPRLLSRSATGGGVVVLDQVLSRFCAVCLCWFFLGVLSRFVLRGVRVGLLSVALS